MSALLRTYASSSGLLDSSPFLRSLVVQLSKNDLLLATSSSEPFVRDYVELNPVNFGFLSPLPGINGSSFDGSLS